MATHAVGNYGQFKLGGYEAAVLVIFADLPFIRGRGKIYFKGHLITCPRQKAVLNSRLSVRVADRLRQRNLPPEYIVKTELLFAGGE